MLPLRPPHTPKGEGRGGPLLIRWLHLLETPNPRDVLVTGELTKIHLRTPLSSRGGRRGAGRGGAARIVVSKIAYCCNRIAKPLRKSGLPSRLKSATSSTPSDPTQTFWLSWKPPAGFARNSSLPPTTSSNPSP